MAGTAEPEEGGGRGRGRGVRAPDFGRSVNPNSTGERQIMPLYLLDPTPPDFYTLRRPCMDTMIVLIVITRSFVPLFFAITHPIDRKNDHLCR